MSYRSIKKILGESSLERKIRILFLISILILVGGSFLWVNRITEDQIRVNMRHKALTLSYTFMLRKHLSTRHSSGQADDYAQTQIFETIGKEFETSTEYKGDSLILDGNNRRWQVDTNVVSDPDEREIVAQLVEEMDALQAEQDRQSVLRELNKDAPQPEPRPGNPDLVDEQAISNVIVESKSKRRFFGNTYAFYVPVLFKQNCINCHHTIYTDPDQQKLYEENLAKPRSEDEDFKFEFDHYRAAPNVVLRITLPYQEAKSAINRSRAILITVAIVTAALATIALYLIVRYVIVKPLKHIRDVADRVGHGHMDVRAELNTGDEFEDLSKSFNRMLRHLLDTQYQLRSANTDLDKKVDEQAQLNLKLHEMNQIKSEFLANMSHELRTPLNSIIGFSEVLENAKGLEGKQKRFAQNIQKSGRLLLELINDILDLAKLEAGHMEVNPADFRMHHLCTQLCEMVRPLAESKRIHLGMDVDPELPPVYHDQMKVRQILTNLLSNAIKFTPEGGRINISVQRTTDGQLRIAVRDTGVGIAEEEHEIIFEKFRQGPSAIGGDTLTREISGTGLGLSIVSEICILLGGTIELESEVGKGSIFTVVLPWEYKKSARLSSELTKSIDEITKQNRINFARTVDLPQVADEAGAQAANADVPDASKSESASNSSENPPQDSADSLESTAGN